MYFRPLMLLIVTLDHYSLLTRFLPYTIGFDVEQANSRHASSSSQPIAVPTRHPDIIQDASVTSPIPDILQSLASSVQSPGRHAGSTSGTEGFFFSQHRRSISGDYPALELSKNAAKSSINNDLIQDLSSSLELPALSFNLDPPRRRIPFLQPHSRPSSPPPSQKIVDDRKPVDIQQQLSLKFERKPKNLLKDLPFKKKNDNRKDKKEDSKNKVPKEKPEFSVDEAGEPIKADTSQDEFPVIPSSRKSPGIHTSKFPPRSSASTLNTSFPATNSSSSVSSPRSPRSPNLYPVSRYSRPRRMTADLVTEFSRAPWTVEPQTLGNGGLKNAIKRAQQENRVSNVLWIGTPGMPTDLLDEESKSSIDSKLQKDYNSVPVFVSDSTFEGHYTHYCKQILWPTLHYQIPDNPKSKAYEDHSWEHYRALNQAVADKIISTYKRGDVIWVNDYHLLLVCQMVREKLPNARMGFFLHVAFPSSEVFRCLASRSQLLQGMLGANCIGFQIPEYARHFLQTCNRILAVDTSTDSIRTGENEGVRHGSHDEGDKRDSEGVSDEPPDIQGVRTGNSYISVVVDPIGIDPPYLRSWMLDPEVIRWRGLIREKWPANIKLIVGRDKLDAIRGVKQKLLAYEQFLKNHPDWIDRVVLIQVCLVNVNEQELESDITTIVDRINAMSPNLASKPVVFLHQDIDFAQYMALLAEADAFVVTSLREGMNLTCYEFVYCNEVQGPLILSEFTGAASILRDDAILVNPWDKRQMAEAYYNALTMSTAEKMTRWQALYEYVSENTCTEWVDSFTQAIGDGWAEQQRRNVNNVPLLSLVKLRQAYQAATIHPQLQMAEERSTEHDKLDVVSTANSKIPSIPSLPGTASAATLSKPLVAKRIFLLNLDSAFNKSSNPSHTTRPINLRRSGSSTSLFSANSGSSVSLQGLLSQSPQRVPTINESTIANASASNGAYPSSARSYLSQQRKLTVLYDLINDPGNIVYVLSGDSKLLLERMFRHVTGVGLIAESGGAVRPYGDDVWIPIGEEAEWINQVEKLLESVSERLPGSSIEKQEKRIIFHVDRVPDPDRVALIIGECVSQINDGYASYHVRARFVDNKVIVSSEEVSTVKALEKVLSLERERGAKFEMIFLASEGGDSDDDDMVFRWINRIEEAGEIPWVYTVSVGSSGRLAKWTVEGMNGLLNALLFAMRPWG